MNLSSSTAAELAALYKDGKSSPDQAIASLSEAILSKDSKLNSYVRFDRGQAKRRETAKGPLAGIPIAIKDNICVEGQEATCASKILQGYVAPYNATVIEKLFAAGAVILGRTNMDEFAFGSSSETSFYGPAKNPWDTDCVPGG